MGTTLDKQSVSNTIAGMPDRFSIDELIDKLVVIQKIDTAINQGINGEIINEQDMENRFSMKLNHTY